MKLVFVPAKVKEVTVQLSGVVETQTWYLEMPLSGSANGAQLKKIFYWFSTTAFVVRRVSFQRRHGMLYPSIFFISKCV